MPDIFDQAAAEGHRLQAENAVLTAERDTLALTVTELEAALAECRNPTGQLMPLLAGVSARDVADSDPLVTIYNPRLSWAKFQPTGPSTHSAEYVESLFDRAAAEGKQIRFRLDAGRFTPSWLYAEAGSFQMQLPATEGHPQIAFTAARWWTPTFRARYRQMLERLAPLVDGRIPAITLCLPQTFYTEPFIKQASLDVNRATLEAQGWNADVEREAYSDAIQAHADLFKKTRTFLAFNPGQTYVSTRTPKWEFGDNPFTFAVMDEFVEVLGDRAIVQNNSPDRAKLTTAPAYVALYNKMEAVHTAGVPISFQTNASNFVEDDLDFVMDQCVAMGAHLIELPGRWRSFTTREKVAQIDAQLKVNASG